MALPNVLILRDVIGSRPSASAGTAGRLFISTDESKVYRDNGSTWDEIIISDASTTETLTNKTIDGDDNTIRLKTSSADVSNPPTDAELDSAFGTPATVGNGFSALLDDAGGDTNVYAVYSNGTSWFYTILTKAV